LYMPGPIDTEPFDISGWSKRSVALQDAFHLANYSGTKIRISQQAWFQLTTRQGNPWQPRCNQQLTYLCAIQPANWICGVC
jgi:hypothetical protein